MELEEAIDLIKPTTFNEAVEKVKYYGGFNGIDKAIERLNEASWIAVKAMEKQMPKEIIWVNDIPWCKCGQELNENYDDYCCNCGQAIKWGD